LNLKKEEDVSLFHAVALDVAKLVKKYRGSLSGEHGIGRLRGEFLPLMIGEHNYGLLRKIKAAWDPLNIFNPGKIIDTPPMTSHLRYEPGEKTRDFPTYFRYDRTFGFMRAIEQCNGSGDCRKSQIMGGVMCPSFMATGDEQHLTRGRANLLREILTRTAKPNPFDHEELYRALDLCLSCKACKSECPSNVDMTKLKAEFLQHYYESNPVSLRTRLMANIHRVHAGGALLPVLTNFLSGKAWILKRLGIAEKRSIPPLPAMTLAAWFKEQPQVTTDRRRVYLFNDEFTNYADAGIGKITFLLLKRLGYDVRIPVHEISGRAYLSKGFLKKAKRMANKNTRLLKDVVSGETPLVGIEPSAILCFRDEYIDLVDPSLRDDAERIAANALMIDEFLAGEIEKGRITSHPFTKEKRLVKLHGQCLQKALSSTAPTKKILSLPANYTVEEINSGCCGMAGAFGYEAEHYDISMKIGELILFPAVREADERTIIVAPGTSCRHHIKDGTGRTALHPVEVLWEALQETHL
jgi:Fe-S oxidoreductase